MIKPSPMEIPQVPGCPVEGCGREDCCFIFETCKRRLNAIAGIKPKHQREDVTMKVLKVVCAVFFGLFLIGFTSANASKISKAVNNVINPPQEAVTKIEATDGNLADLEKLLGTELRFVLPRDQKMDYEIVKIKVARSRFGKDAARNQRMFFFSLTSIPVEEAINGKNARPYTTAITQKGSVIRFPRNLNVEDVKVVTVFSGKVLRVIELI